VPERGVVMVQGKQLVSTQSCRSHSWV
jgi:hypothetical protein